MTDEKTPSPNDDGQIQSPCIRVCIVDGPTGLCLGCLRTLPEIAAWGTMTTRARAEIMAGLPARLERIAPERRLKP